MRAILCSAFALLLVTITFAEEKQPLTPAPVAARASQAKSDPKWLLGEWIFDGKFTEQKRAEEQKSAADKPDLFSALSGTVAEQLTDKLDGAHLKFGEKEYVITMKDGNGKSVRYEVIDSTDPNTASLKEEVGTVTAFHREGDRLWMNSTGNVAVPFYFSRAK